MLWSQVEPKIVSCVLKKHGGQDASVSLAEAVREQDAFVRKKVPGAVVKLLPKLLYCQTGVGATKASANRK